MATKAETTTAPDAVSTEAPAVAKADPLSAESSDPLSTEARTGITHVPRSLALRLPSEKKTDADEPPPVEVDIE